jgi:DNA-binding GntR family transcriptional regulator
MPTRPQATSIIDALAEELRVRIFRSDLTSGTRLTETDLASTYEVARPTAKAAIEKLVAEGLLRRDAHRTARVPSMSRADIEDLYFSRIFVEREVAGRLAACRQVPDAARQALIEIEAVGEASSIDIVEPDVRFHESLVDAVGSKRISRLYRALMGEMRLCMAQVQAHGLLQASTIAAEHAAILDHIEAGDAEAAGQAVYDHLTRARDELAPFLERAADR